MTATRMKYPTAYLFFSIILACVNASAAQDDRPGSGIFEGSYDFDARGRLMALTKPDGRVIRYEYQDGGRIASITTPEDSVRFKYDENGNCVEVANGIGRTKYTFDPLNRLTAVTYDYPALKKGIAYEYDPWGRVSRAAAMSDAGAEESVTVYEYDIFGRLKHVNIDGFDMDYDYGPNGRTATRTLSNEIKSIYTYEPLGNIEKVEHFCGQNKIAEFEYAYDAGGLMTGCVSSSPDKPLEASYEYTGGGLLSGVKNSDESRVKYTYGQGGAIKSINNSAGSTQVVRDGKGFIVQIGQARFAYDGAGNITSIEDPSFKEKRIYDTFDRLKESSSPQGTAKYDYSAEGYLIGCSDGAGRRSFIPDPFSVTGRPFLTSGHKFHSANPVPDLSVHFGNPKIEVKLGDGTGDPCAMLSMETGKYSHNMLSAQDTMAGPSAWKIKMIEKSGPISVMSMPALSGFDRSTLRPQGDALNMALDRAAAGSKFYQNVSGIIDEGMKLPMPSAARIQNHDLYWKSGQYWKDDPYYQDMGMFRNAGPVTMEQFAEDLERWPGEVMQVSSRTIGLTALGMIVRPALMIADWVPMQKPLLAGVGLGGIKGFVKGGWDLLRGDLDNYRYTEELGMTFDRVNRGLERLESLSETGSLLANIGRNFYDAWQVRRTWQWDFGNPPRWAAVGTGGEFQGDWRHWHGRTSWQWNWQEFTMRSARDVGGYLLSGLTENMVRSRVANRNIADGNEPRFGGGAVAPVRDALNNLGDRWQPKGVKFDKSAEFFGRIGAIAGVNFDPKTKRLTLIGDGNPELPAVRLDDFIAAIQVVYGDHPGEPEDPTFSLDPENPANPAGDWLRAVYSPGMLAGTHMGDVMFKADWMLKQYAFGVIADQEGNIIGKRVSSVGEYKSYMELFKRDPSAQKKLAEGGEICSRFWILPLEMKLARSGNTLIFIRSTMQVQTRRMELVDGQLKDSPDNSDPAAENFANIFTAYYDELARESPVLEEAREAAKVVAIVKWLKDKGMGANDFKIDWSTTPRSDDYVKKVRSLSISACGEWGIGQSVRLVGGVELSPIPIESSSTAASVNLDSGIEMELNSQAATSVTQMEGGTGRYLISSLPVTPASGDFIRQHPITVHDGVTYAADMQLRTRRAFDEFGNNAIYDYDGAGRITGVHFFTPQNWQLHGSISDTGAKSLALHTPNGDDVVCRFHTDGLIADISIDGRPVTRFSRSRTGESVEVERLKTFEEFPIGDISAEAKKVEKVVSRDKIVYGNGTVQYIREPVGGKPAKSETISCRFSDDKMTFEATGVAPITIEKKDETSVVEKSSDEQTTYEYAPDGNGIKKISRENGDSMEFFYGGKGKPGLETVLKVRKGSATAEVARSNNSIVIRDFRGAETIYRYEGNRLQGIESPLGKTTCDYDDNNLTAIHYPDGSVLRFDWARGAGVDRVSVWREAAV